MFTGLILQAAKGHVPPDAFLEKATSLNKSCAGLAFVDNGVVQTMQEVTEPTVEGLKEGLNTFKDHTVMVHMGNSDTPLTPEDTQPFMALRSDTGDGILAILLEGNFPRFAKDSGHPPEYHVVHDYLKPRIEKIYRLCKGDIPTLIDELQDQTFIDDAKSTYDERGNIFLLTCTGKLLYYGENKDGAEFEWGGTTKIYDYNYKEGSYPAKAEEPKKPAFSLGSKPTAKKAEEKPPVIGLAKPTSTAIPTATERWVKPPERLKGNKNPLKNWYNEWGGKCPEDYRDMPAIKITGQKLAKWDAARVKSLQDLDRGEEVPVPTTAPQPEPQPSVQEPEITKPAAVPAVAPKPDVQTQAPVGKVTPLILTQAKIKTFLDGFLKDKTVINAVDRHSKLLLADPAKAQEVEKKRATIKQALGISLEETYNWPPEVIMDLCSSNPEVAAFLLLDYRQDLWETRALLADASPTKTEEKPEPVAAKPAAAAASGGGMFSTTRPRKTA